MVHNTGVEGLAGIPGQVGGGVAMNAGTRWGCMWDAIEEVHVLTPDGETRTLPRDQCRPGYRNGNLRGAVVLAVQLGLSRGEKGETRERIREYLAEKSAAQPLTERSSGCVFQNPARELSDGRTAGQLIDDCGGKGLTRRDAVVSEKHANFIVNRGRARAADVLGLIEDVRGLVRDASGVELVTEVKFWERTTETTTAPAVDAWWFEDFDPV